LINWQEIQDESEWPVWPEIVSRFFITSPNMNPGKYRKSNLLIAQRAQQSLIVSDFEVDLAKKCILFKAANYANYYSIFYSRLMVVETHKAIFHVFESKDMDLLHIVSVEIESPVNLRRRILKD
jgi:hypothetical protein